MTKDQIDKINIGYNYCYNQLPKKLDQARKSYFNLLESCDHRYPNGKSAMDTEGMFCCLCKICGWNDL